MGSGHPTGWVVGVDFFDNYYGELHLRKGVLEYLLEFEIIADVFFHGFRC